MQPLEGITVIALEQAVAAPLPTRHLADLGARVIKIERPGVGDFARAYDTTVGGLSSHFVWLNRSKQSLTLDVKAAEARAVLGRLLTRADVFVQNLAPSAAERVSLGTGELRQKYPRLIVCNLSGYGASGPYRDKKAYDLLIQSEAGLLSITGTEEEPSKAGISVADIAGGMYAYSAILTALFMRQLMGQGTTIEVSLFEALGEWMGYPAYYTKYGGKVPARTDSAHAAIAPYGPCESGDQKRVFLFSSRRRHTGFDCDWSSDVCSSDLPGQKEFQVTRVKTDGRIGSATPHSELKGGFEVDNNQKAQPHHGRLGGVAATHMSPSHEGGDRKSVV